MNKLKFILKKWLGIYEIQNYLIRNSKPKLRINDSVVKNEKYLYRKDEWPYLSGKVKGIGDPYWNNGTVDRDVVIVFSNGQFKESCESKLEKIKK